MLCTRNHLRLMWMDATGVGKDPVPCLGYVEWPLTGPAPFRLSQSKKWTVGTLSERFSNF